MTQPIDVAYVEIKPDLKDFSRDAKKETDKAFGSIERSASNASDRIESTFKETATKIGDLFQGADGKLRNAKGQYAALGDTATDALNGIGQAAQKAVSGGLSGVLGILSGMTGMIGQLAAAGPAGIAVLAGAFLALAAAAAVAVAVLQNLVNIALFGAAVLPGVIAGAIAGFGILKVAVNGVAEAFEEESKASTKSAGVAINNARQVADAQRGVVEAQRNLIKAREEELERIQDVRRELIAARTAEKRATDNVLKAEYELEQARKKGTPRQVIEAQLALEEANAALAESKDRTEDLAKEKAKADKVGVDGSDKVLAAMEALRDAQDRLAQSQQKFSAGAGGQARAIDSLSESAQAFVRAIIAAKKELAPLAGRIQEAFFSGTAPLIPPIVDNIKSLEPEILRVTDAFNAIFKEILTFFGSDEAESAASGALGGLASFLEAITPAITPLLEAFGVLIGDSEDFGAVLGGKVADALLGIADFVKNVDLEQLFADAKTAIADLTPIVTSLWNILKALWNILLPIGEFLLPMVESQLELMALQFDILSDAVEFVKTAFVAAYNWISTETPKVFNAVMKWISDLPENIKKLGPKLLEAGKNIMAKLWEGLKTGGGFLADVGKVIANSVIDFLNRNVIGAINRGLDSIEKSLNDLPLIDGVNIPTIPSIPRLAKGGVSMQNTLAEISEGNKREAVLPLEDPRAMAMVGNAIAKAGGASGMGDAPTFGPGAIVVNFNGAVPTEAEAFRTGQAVGAGIAERLARRNLKTTVRMI